MIITKNLTLLQNKNNQSYKDIRIIVTLLNKKKTWAYLICLCNVNILELGDVGHPVPIW